MGKCRESDGGDEECTSVATAGSIAHLGGTRKDNGVSDVASNPMKNDDTCSGFSWIYNLAMIRYGHFLTVNISIFLRR